MSSVEKVSVALTPELASEMRAAVGCGDYGSVGEVVHDALRDWRLRRRVEEVEIEEMRRLVQQGAANGTGPDGGPIFARLRVNLPHPAAE